MRSLIPLLAFPAVATATLGVAAIAQDVTDEVSMRVKGVGRDAAAGPIYLLVETGKDIDGDGVPEAGVIRLNCSGSGPAAAALHYDIKSPRDSASGQASGKKTTPVRSVKEWGATTPQLYQVRLSSTDLPKITPKIAKESHGRVAVAGGWQPVSLAEPAAVCRAATDAVTRSRVGSE